MNVFVLKTIRVMSLYLPLPTNWHNSIENIRSLINCFDPAKNEQKKGKSFVYQNKSINFAAADTRYQH